MNTSLGYLYLRLPPRLLSDDWASGHSRGGLVFAFFDFFFSSPLPASHWSQRAIRTKLIEGVVARRAQPGQQANPPVPSVCLVQIPPTDWPPVHTALCSGQRIFFTARSDGLLVKGSPW